MNERSCCDSLDNTVDTEIRLDQIDDFRTCSLNLAGQAQRTLEILSHDLDAAIFDRQPFLAAVKSLCLRNHLSQVRILLQDNSQVQKKGHRLVEMVRRLPSSMEIRRPHPDYIDHQENFLIVDRRAYIRWRLSNRYQGHAACDSRLKAQSLCNLFIEIWQCSQPDSDLRRLNL